MSVQAFRVEITIEAVLLVDEIWPNGDAPDAPTVDDVRSAIKRYGSLKEVAGDWELWSGGYVGLSVRETTA